MTIAIGLLVGITASVWTGGLVLAIWYLGCVDGRQSARGVAAAAATICLVWQAHLMLNPVQRPAYGTIASTLAPWRSVIGPEQTVLLLGNPLGHWGVTLTLFRSSYNPAVGGIFSRAGALAALEREAELERRAAPLGQSLFQRWPSDRPPPPLAVIRNLCAPPGPDFVAAPFLYDVPHWGSAAPEPFRGFNLYACRDVLGVAHVG
jgi:hypothetical protein